MTVDAWITECQSQLDAAGIGTSRLDCLVLLEDETSKDRAWLLAHPDTKLTKQQLENLKKQIERRTKHIPLAQIRGKTEFYGREFIINEHVLEPRPESETMLELLFEIELPENTKIADVGCGSGALGITAKLHLTDTEVVLIDIDPLCLDVAQQNAKLHKAKVELIQGNLLKPLKSMSDVLLCNLPYVPENYQINQAAMNEPRIAIFGGQDGLDIYRQLFEQIVYSDNKPLYLCCESLPFQHKALKAMAKKAGYSQLKEADFIQVFRNDGNVSTSVA